MTHQVFERESRINKFSISKGNIKIPSQIHLLVSKRVLEIHNWLSVLRSLILLMTFKKSKSKENCQPLIT